MLGAPCQAVKGGAAGRRPDAAQHCQTPHWLPATTLFTKQSSSGSRAPTAFLRDTAACNKEPAREQLLPVTVSSCCRASAVPLQEDISSRPRSPHEAMLSQILQALLNAEQVCPALLRERHEVVATV